MGIPEMEILWNRLQSSYRDGTISKNAGKAYYKCHVGVVMTNSTFTLGAKQLADATGILLWDRDYVCSLINNSLIK